LAYKNLFEENCEVVQRFDEVILEKASKISLEERIRHLEARYDPVMVQLSKSFAEAEEERRRINNGFNTFTELVSNKINESVRRTINQRLKPTSDYDGETMTKVLGVKADKADL
jgi:hypothetical protein